MKSLCDKKYHPCDRPAVYVYSYEGIDINNDLIKVVNYYCMRHAEIFRKINPDIAYRLQLINPKLASML